MSPDPPVPGPAGGATVPTISVVVATIDRPDVLRTCLEHLRDQVVEPHEVIVVDASEDDRSALVVRDFDFATYLRNEEGLGSLTTSRQIGYEHATGEVIAYIDDDAFAEPSWSSSLGGAYDDPGIGAVCGRVINPDPFPPSVPDDQIGRLFPNGTLTGNFFARSSGPLDVDHAMGANMSYRRDVIDAIGGVPQVRGGNSNHHEDLAFSLAVRNAGYRVRFEPGAAVLHVGAPQPVGRRFDVRYDYYGNRNLILVLSQAYGPRAPITRAVVRRLVVEGLAVAGRRAAGSVAHLGATFGGVAAGLFRGRATGRTSTPTIVVSAAPATTRSEGPR